MKERCGSVFKASRVAAFATVIFFACFGCDGNSNTTTLSTAVDAYTYGYPLLITEYTRQSMLASGQLQAMNQFTHIPTLLTPPNDRLIRRSNNDTLYSEAFLDLKAEPIILHVPDTSGLYYVMQIMDAWTNTFAAPGTRATGTSAGDFAIVGPNWKGSLPPSLTVLQSPTNLVWIIGRTQVNTNAPAGNDCVSIDYSAVHNIQQQYTLTPLSRWPAGATSSPSGGTPTATASVATPPELIAQLTGVQFFQTLSTLMADNPAASADQPALQRFAGIGFIPGKPFDPPVVYLSDINAASTYAVPQMSDKFNHLGELINGWRVTVSGIGAYGTDYLSRAGVAYGAPGANLPEDGFYPATNVDKDGQQLNSSKRYRIPFNPVPPVNAFWSVTMYDSNGYLFNNTICRYAIHSTDQAIAGQTAVELLLQPNPPTDSSKAGFWLPTPDGDFNVVLRMYWPDQSALQKQWVPPQITVIQP